MTAPLFWLSPGALAGSPGSPGAVVGDELVLDGAEGHHAVTVRRVRVGESVLLADGSGLLAGAVVTGLGRGELTARIESLRDAAPGAPRLVLVQALAKEGRDEAAVETATELGVDEIVPWQAGRSVVIWRGERGEKSLRKWRNVASAAAKQSRRATLPAVPGVLATPALAARVAECVAGGGTAYVLYESATLPLAAADVAAASEVLLIVGPEGGIAPEELAVLETAGAAVVRLGDTVLRSGSAGPAALAVVLAATRWRA